MSPSTAQHPSQIMAYLHRLAYQRDLKQEPQCQSIIQAKGQKSKCILKSQLIQETTQILRQGEQNDAGGVQTH